MTAEKYIYSESFVPSYSEMLEKHGTRRAAATTYPTFDPKSRPMIDPSFFPLAEIYISEELYGAALQETKFHERCHIYEIMSQYDVGKGQKWNEDLIQASKDHVKWFKRHPE